MNKHTPGPWEVGKLNVAHIDGFPLNRIPISGGGYAIAAVWAGDARRQGPIMGLQEMHQANASLIAASPDLLSALRDCLEQMHHPNGERAYDIAQAAERAIAKAEGRK